MSVIEIVTGAGALGDVAPVPAGPVTLRLRVRPDLAGAWVGVVRLRPGVALEQFTATLRAAYARDGSGTEAGLRVDTEAELLGGAAATPDTAVEVRLDLEPGTHHLVDYKRIATGADDAEAVTALEVSPAADAAADAAAPAAPVEPAATVTLRGDGAAIECPDVLPAGRPLRVHNATGQFNEAVWMMVRDDATPDDVEKFFRAIIGGEAPPIPDLIRSQPTGVVPMGPGRGVVATLDVPAGRYAVTTWITDYRRGGLFSLQGMIRLVDVVRDGV